MALKVVVDMANQRTYIRCVSLLGKLDYIFNVLTCASNKTIDLSPEELDLMRMAATEYQFYHAHERFEAGTEQTNPGDIPKQESESGKARKREVLSLKAAR